MPRGSILRIRHNNLSKYEDAPPARISTLSSKASPRRRMGPGAFKRQRGPVSTGSKRSVSSPETKALRATRARPLDIGEFCDGAAKPPAAFAAPRLRRRQSRSGLIGWSHGRSNIGRENRLRLAAQRAVHARGSRTPISQSRRVDSAQFRPLSNQFRFSPSHATDTSVAGGRAPFSLGHSRAVSCTGPK